MGAWRRRTRGWTRGARAAAVTGLAVLAVAGAVACEPGGIGSAAVAYTTDEAATAEIERRDVDVRWLTCTADYGDGGSGGRETVASVDCEGETGNGRDVTVAGHVTRAVDGFCVRGDLRADVGGKQLFRVSGLGDCGSATPSPLATPRSAQPAEPGRPTVTVTVTRTVWCGDDTRCGSTGTK
ncbi:hypothetical protein ACIRPQ_11605 [Streptomyces sp. NPDC101213]|uniref:hypothetical protein n=1 Tax=Streptomyces sp. NPDC101213 TaxID=3366130 RepID=UPI0037F220D4